MLHPHTHIHTNIHNHTHDTSTHTPICRPFTYNTAAQFIYFFKCLYFIVSGKQIVAGYPTRVLGYFLGKKYTTLSGYAFTGYRYIPLLPELREVMDWMFTDTTLPLTNWVTVQEIYAQIYFVKVDKEGEKVGVGGCTHSNYHKRVKRSN